MRQLGQWISYLIMLIVVGFYLSGEMDQVSWTSFCYEFLAVLLVLMGFRYVFAPISIRRSQWIAMEVNFAAADPAAPTAPQELREHFAQRSVELELLGFTYECSYRTIQSTSNADGFISLFRHSQTLETARLLTAIARTETLRKVVSLVVLSTEFADGTEVVTSNRAEPIGFPPIQPPYHGAAFPQIRATDRLLQIHRGMVRRYDQGIRRLDPVGDDPGGYIREKESRALAHHVACGYFYIDESAGVQRLTWKGAYLMTWKLAPPNKQINQAWERYRAARLIRALDNEQWVHS